MIYADSWPWRAGSKRAERRDRQWIETSAWSRSTLPWTGCIVSHAAQGGHGNTSHRPVSAPRICQQKGQESSGGTPGTCQELLVRAGTDSNWNNAHVTQVRTHTHLSGSALQMGRQVPQCVWCVGTRIAIIVLSRVWFFETPWTAARQAPLSTEYWSGLPFPPPRVLPNPGIELASPTLQVDSLPLGKPLAHVMKP